MMIKAVLLATLMTACATGATTMSARYLAPDAHAKLQLSAGIASDVDVIFPTLVYPAVPRIDRIAREVRGTLGDRATAELELCVATSGTVTKATLAKSSSFEAFDHALVDDARSWQFEQLPGPSSLQTCKRTVITYRPY